MLRTERSALCAYEGCSKPSTITLIIEGRDEPVEHRVCYTHFDMAQAIAKQHHGFAYRTIRPRRRSRSSLRSH
jgi:hypothetical protein